MRSALLAIAVLVLSTGAARTSTNNQPPASAEASAGRELPGSSALPVFVKITPNPPDLDERRREDAERARQTLVDWWTVGLTALLTLFAFAQVVVTVITLKGLQHAKVAANAAVKAAETAKQTVDTMMATERAYVFFSDAREITMGDEQYAELLWRNFGKTPAVVSGIAAHCGAFDEPPNPRETYSLPVPAGALIGADETWAKTTIPLALPREALASGKRVFLYGQITYRDIHGVERHSWFCRLFTDPQFILGLYTDPALNGFD